MSHAQTCLVGDIGGTNARFALLDAQGKICHQKKFLCKDYEGLEEAVYAFIESVGHDNMPLKSASLAIAGPVTGDVFQVTNNPWTFSISKTQGRLGLERLRVFNDFEALALGIPYLQDGDFYQIGTGERVDRAPIGVIGPGTGLGASFLAWDEGRYVAYPTEGGHVTMPAKTQREFDVFDWMTENKYSHVSAERVCSGKGLVNLYNALCGLDGKDLPEREAHEISTAGMAGTCDTCKESLDMMCSFLGRVAGNLALTLGANGGIFIAGGIVPKLGEYFKNSEFREEFYQKGRFRDYNNAIPTYVITHPDPAFVGLKESLKYCDSD